MSDTTELDWLEARVRELEAALREADDLLRRLSEWDMLFLGDGQQNMVADGPYWKQEIAKGRAALAAAGGAEGDTDA